MAKNTAILIFLIGLLLRLVLSIQIYSGDVNNHIAWGKDSVSFGFAGIYEREFFQRYGTLSPTYPPLPIFFFTAFYWLYEEVYKLAWNLNISFSLFPSNFIFFLEDQDTLPAFLKIPAILADLGIAVIVFLFTRRLVDNRKMPLLASVLVLFNPAFFYNSAYWGQIESVPLFFVLTAFYMLLYSKKFLIAAIFLTLALLTKQTSVVFIPVFALVFFRKYGLVNSIKATSVSVLILWLAFLPFFKKGNILLFPFSTYLNKIQTGSGSDFVTDHAFNFWALVTGLGKISDSTPFWLGISFNFWGYVIFSLITIGVLYKLSKDRDIKNTLFAASLVSFAAFLFLTRMHERYLEQTIPFLLLIVVKEPKKYMFPFFIISIFHFLNLYHNWWAPRLQVFVELLIKTLVIDVIIVIAIGIFSLLFVDYLKGTKR